MAIHPTAIVDSQSRIAESAEIGPYCIIGAHVEIGARTRLMAHVYIEGVTSIGEDNVFHPYSTIGVASQDLKYKGEPAETRIGNRNKIREFVTIHRGTEGGGLVTEIGDDNLVMAYAHIAHDVRIGSHTIISERRNLRRPRHGGGLGGDRRFQRRASILPGRPTRHHRRLQRDHAGRSAVFDDGQPARVEGVRRE